MFRLHSGSWWLAPLSLRERSPLHPVTAMIQGLYLLIAVASLGWAQTQSTAYLIDTVAGKDGPLNAEPAVDAWLASPNGLATDKAGNLYVSDFSTNRVLRIKSDGTRETFVGPRFEPDTGLLCGFSGDGGPATEARLCLPGALAFGPDGSLYVVDTNNVRIRKVSPSGTITTVAGSGTRGFSGDGGLATMATFFPPGSIAVDPTGNLYIADGGNRRVRKVDTQGMISTFAGNGGFGSGGEGDGGPATEAPLTPSGVAVGLAGEVYIAGDRRIRVVDGEGNINPFAGGGSSTDNGSPTDYRFGGQYTSGPGMLAVDSVGGVYISDPAAHKVLRSTADFIETIVGTGAPGFAGDGGPAIDALLNLPAGISLSETGGETTIYIADSANHRVRAVTGGKIRTVAGISHLAGDGGPATEALLDGATDVAVDASGSLYIAEALNHVLRKVAGDGTITTVAEVVVEDARQSSPQAVLVTHGGDLLISDTVNNRVLRIGEGGVAEPFAGTGAHQFQGDGGPATEAALSSPIGLAEDSEGSIYVASASDHRIRKVGPDSIIDTVAGNGAGRFSGDTGLATDASLYYPYQVVVDHQGNVFITDSLNRRVRRVTPEGFIDTVAGGGNTPVEREDIPALEADIGEPWGLVIENPDSDGKGADGETNVFISSGTRIYRLDVRKGAIRTIAGSSFGFRGDGGPALDARLRVPQGMATDDSGNIYVADFQHVRKLTPVVTRVNTGGVVNAASIAFSVATDTAAPETIVSIYGIGLSIADGNALSLPLPTQLGGVTVEVTDSQGISRLASLFAVRENQINCLIPAGVALGPATLTVTNSLGSTSETDIQIVAVAPGLFAINGGGEGLAAATAFRRDADLVDTPLPVFNAAVFPFEPLPIDLGGETDLVVLSLFGTGIRGYQNLIAATIGGEAAQVLGFAPSGQFEGLDQINLLIPRSLIGRGVVEVQITVDGQMLNPVTITVL